jgi:hypothetical protein
MTASAQSLGLCANRISLLDATTPHDGRRQSFSVAESIIDEKRYITYLWNIDAGRFHTSSGNFFSFPIVPQRR